MKRTQMVHLYHEGYSIRQIAKLANRCYTTVHYHLKLADVPFRPRGQRQRKSESAV